MRRHLKWTVAVIAAVVGIVPAMAVAAGPEYNPGGGPSYGTPPPHGKAYGFYCQGESKKHVKGEKGTAFSRCVHRMQAADGDDGLTARAACKGLSKKHLKGHKGTAFSRCVRAVAKMRKDHLREGVV
jgi:hypothetical protein